MICPKCQQNMPALDEEFAPLKPGRAVAHYWCHCGELLSTHLGETLPEHGTTPVKFPHCDQFDIPFAEITHCQ